MKLQITHWAGIHFLCLLTLLLGALPQAMASTIEWQLENRFRAFDYENAHQISPQASARLYEKISYDDRESASTWIDRIEASGGSPYAGSSGPWIEDVSNENPRYVDDYVQLPSQLSIGAKLSGLEEQDSHDTCEWSLNDSVVRTASCGEAITRVVFAGDSGTLIVRRAGKTIAQALVKPTLNIIVGLGDSYGAGEGSPDAPTVWKDDGRGATDATWPLGDLSAIDKLVKTPARWQSSRCNRSFYSYQNLVALRIAAIHPHESTVFVQFSCAGAEIIDGLLAPQRLPSGHVAKKCEPSLKRKPVEMLDKRCDVPVSQLRAAVQALCSAVAIPIDDHFRTELQDGFAKTRYADYEPSWINDLLECPVGQLKRPNLVLLSVGGNDMGFSGVIAWGLLPAGRLHGIPPQVLWSNYVTGIARKEGGIVCPFAGSSADCKSPQSLTAIERIAELPMRYRVLNIALQRLLLVNPRDIIANQYPNSLQDDMGSLCGNPVRENHNNAWYATRALIPRYLFPTKWEVNLTESEASVVNVAIIPELNKEIEKTNEELQWTTVTMRGVMDNKGWCTGDFQTFLSPPDAHTWHAYTNNVRMIRTGNDSFLTQWPGETGRRDGIDGTFHPNAQGYSAMADAVMKALH